MIDLVLGVLIAGSALLGLLRGFVGIVVGTASWLLAGWAAFRFGSECGLWLARGQAPDTGHVLGGYALVFVGVLVAVGLIGHAIRAAVQATRLSGTDRLLGLCLGLLRGLFFGCVLVLLLGFTPLPREPAWQQSRLLPVLLPGVRWMRAQLPQWNDMGLDLPSMSQPGMGTPASTGDNGTLEPGLGGPHLRQGVSGTMGAFPGAAPASPDHRADALPTPIPDPAQVRPGQPDPARADGHHARPSPRQQ